MNALEVTLLNKTYSGKRAVRDLSFSLDQGEILGIIGPNGAGKNTSIKSILDFIRTDSGMVSMFSHSLDDTIKNQLGYLPEQRGLNKKLPALELILYLASLKSYFTDQ